MTWIKTTTGERVNTAHANSIKTIETVGRYEVALQFPGGTSNINPSVIFRSETKSEFDAFLDALDKALPMLPIGAHQPKAKPAKKTAKTATKSTSKAPRAKAKQEP